MFFISSTATLGAVKKLGNENKGKPFPQRTRYIIIDFHHVRSADHSSVEQVPVPASWSSPTYTKKYPNNIYISCIYFPVILYLSRM